MNPPNVVTFFQGSVPIIAAVTEQNNIDTNDQNFVVTFPAVIHILRDQQNQTQFNIQCIPYLMPELQKDPSARPTFTFARSSITTTNVEVEDQLRKSYLRMLGFESTIITPDNSGLLTSFAPPVNAPKLF